MSERGSAMPFAVACLGLLLFVGAALGVVGATFARHRTAEAAADLGSLAAAAALQQGSDACAAATRVVAADGAHLATCALDGEEVAVTVVVDGPGWMGQHGDLRATARAGPAP